MPINSAITERGRFLCHVQRETGGGGRGEKERERERTGEEREGGDKVSELTGGEREPDRRKREKGESGERETDRQTDRQTDKQTDKDRGRWGGRPKEGGERKKKKEEKKKEHK